MIKRTLNTYFKYLLVVMAMPLHSCYTSMTPSRVNETLPSLTKSKFISSTKSNSDLLNDECLILNPNRIYNAPMGLTVKQDLINGAKGIDEWVKVDGGNAYQLVNYQWITVDHLGSTQLKIEFATLSCKLKSL